MPANAALASQGRWQYDTGSGWTDLPAVALTTPFLLKATDQLRFLPAADWNGTPGGLSVRLIDNSAGAVTSGAGPDLTSATGGTTAYSAAAVSLTTSVTPANDAPTAAAASVSVSRERLR